MQNILILARKELLSTFRQRNLLLIMFGAPIVLVAIMGLAFGGLGGTGAPDFADIRVAVVNQDRGFDLQQQLSAGVTTTQLADWQIPFNGASLPVGELLLANPKLDLQATQLLTAISP